jgi:hypothetical protein
MKTRQAIEYAFKVVSEQSGNEAEDAKATLLAILDQQVDNENKTLCDEMDLIIFG